MLPLTRRLTATTLRPLTLEQLKAHLRADSGLVFGEASVLAEAAEAGASVLVVNSAAAYVVGGSVRLNGQRLPVVALNGQTLSLGTEIGAAAEAGQAVEVGTGAEDDALLSLIDDVAAAFEVESKQVLMAAEYVTAYPDFGRGPNAGILRGLVAPVAELLTVTYPDPLTGEPVELTSGTDYALSEWEPGQLLVKTWADLPATYATADAVRVRYRAGYASPAEVPGNVRRWLLLCAGHWYENRQSVAVGLNVTEVPETCKKLMNLIRVPTL